MKNTTKILFGLTLVVFGLIIARVVLSSAFSVDGITLGKVSGQLVALEKENMLLREKLYTASSLTTIASDAASLGLVEEKSHIALAQDSSLAIKQ